MSLVPVTITGITKGDFYCFCVTLGMVFSFKVEKDGFKKRLEDDQPVWFSKCIISCMNRCIQLITSKTTAFEMRYKTSNYFTGSLQNGCVSVDGSE